MSEKFEISFLYNHEKINAVCERSRIGNHPQYFVYIKRPGEVDETYNLIELKKPFRKIASCNYSKERNKMSEIIAKALEDRYKPKKTEKPGMLKMALVKLIVISRSVSFKPILLKSQLQTVKHKMLNLIAETNKTSKESI